MGGGKKTQSTTSNKLIGIAVQSSVAGQVIPRGWGTFRVAANLLWYGDFLATPHTTSTGGGKGGSPKSSNTTYTYTASLILGICQGPITSVKAVYRDQSNFIDGVGTGSALQQAGLSLANGDLGQAPWGYLTSNHPDQALGYSGIAYAYATNYSLDTSGALGNHSFEVVSGTLYGGGPDALPGDIVTDFLPSIPFWAQGLIGDLTYWNSYCIALGLLLSPVLDTQRTGADFLGEMLQATNSDCVWSEGKLKFFTYGDTAVGDFVPNLTPVYDLTDDDFIPSSPGAEPVLSDNTRGADAWNYVQVEYLDRTTYHATQIAIGFDPANIDQYGRLQNTSPYSLHSICNPVTAGQVAQLLVQRTCNVRTKYTFALPGNFDWLEAGIDLVTLTTGDMDRVLVRLLEIKENTQDGRLECTAEEMLVGTGHAAAFTPGGGGGYVVNRNIDPGPTDEVALINPNRVLTNGDYELWIAAAGTSAAWGGAEVWLSWDGVSYGKVGAVQVPGRIGVLANALPDTPDPDTVDVLRIDMSPSGGVILPGSQADADNAVTLALVDNELISYRDATLTATETYSLSYLRRGWYTSTVAAHLSGAPFIRLDEAVAKIPYDPAKVGQIVHIKLRSVNTFGTNLQDLSDATDHIVTLNPGAAPVIDITATNSQALGGVPASQILNDVSTAITNIETLNQEADTLRSDVDSQALALLSQVANAIDLKKYFDKIVWVGTTDVATAVVNETTQRIDGQTATTETIALIGAKSGDGLSFVLSDTTVQASPGVTWGSYKSSISSSFTSTTAAITSEASTRATADSAMASLVALIGASASGGTAFVINSTTLQVSPGTSWATYTSGVSSSIGANSAAITSEASTRATADTTIASNLSTTNTTVGGLSATVSTLSTSMAGVQASWGVALDVNGHLSGIQLVGGSTTSSLTVVASDFIFADPGGATQVPFYISGGTVYADNLVVQLLRANTIVTAHIQTGQVTQLSNTAWFLPAGPGTFAQTLVASAIIDLSDTANTLAHGSWVMDQDGSHLTWGFQVYLDGSSATTWLQFNLAQGVVSFDIPFNSLGAGTHQVDLYISGATQTVFEIGTLSFQGSMR